MISTSRLLAGLLALVVATSPAAAVPAATTPQYAPPRYSGGLRALAGRAGALGGPSVTTFASDGTSTGATSRIRYVVPTGGGGDGIVVCFANWYISATGEVAGYNPITDKAGFEYGSTSYPLTFQGQTSVTIQPGGQACSDPLGIAVTGGSTFYVRPDVTVTAGGKWPISRVLNSANAEGTNANVTAGATGPTSAIRAVPCRAAPPRSNLMNPSPFWRRRSTPR